MAAAAQCPEEGPAKLDEPAIHLAIPRLFWQTFNLVIVCQLVGSAHKHMEATPGRTLPGMTVTMHCLGLALVPLQTIVPEFA